MKKKYYLIFIPILIILILVILFFLKNNFKDDSLTKTTDNTDKTSNSLKVINNTTNIYDSKELISIAFNEEGDSIYLPGDYHCHGTYFLENGDSVDIPYDTDLTQTKTIKQVAEEMPKNSYLSEIYYYNTTEQQKGGFTPLKVSGDLYHLSRFRYYVYDEIYNTETSQKYEQNDLKGYVRIKGIDNNMSENADCILDYTTDLGEPNSKTKLTIKIDYDGPRFSATENDGAVFGKALTNTLDLDK